MSAVTDKLCQKLVDSNLVLTKILVPFLVFFAEALGDSDIECIDLCL